MRNSNVVAAIFGILLSAALANAAPIVLDFQGMGPEGSPVGTIGIATFTAQVAVQGNPQFAFNSGAGADTAYTAPFSNLGNVFITNPGGAGGYVQGVDVRTSTIVVDFASPVTDLSFLVADIDFNEVLLAQVFGAGGGLLGSITVPTNADGVVIPVNFGSITGIEKLVIANSAATPYPGTFPGFGVDNLAFAEVPEPASLAIWSLLSVAGLAAWRRRRSVSAT